MIGLREDQQEGAQLAARIVTFLTTTIAHSGKPPLTLARRECQIGGSVCCIEGRWLTSAYQAASRGLADRQGMSGWRKSR